MAFIFGGDLEVQADVASMWFPVAQRELTVAARWRLTYWVRLAAPALGLLFLFLAVPELASLAPALQGRTIFRYGALALFVYSALAGLCFTAETISSERREGTLPLLQLTGMRELDLILGKLFASALPGIFGFLAAAPLLAIPFLLGGVTTGQFARVIVVVLGTLLLSLAVGIFSSSHTARTGAALKQTATTLVSVFALGGFAILNFLMRGRHLEPNDWHRSFYPGESRWFFVFAMILVWYFELPTGSPCFLLLQALTGVPGIFSFAVSFAIGIALLFGMSAYFLLAARPFLVLEEDEAPVAAAGLPFRRGSIYRRAHLFKAGNPYRWLLEPTDAETILAFGWAMVGGALHLFSNGLIFTRTDESTVLAMNWAAFGVTAFVYFLFARRAAEFLVETRRNGLLEVLLVTPLSWAELLVQHRAAFLRFVWFPATILLAGEIFGVLAAFRVSVTLRQPEFLWSLFVVTILTYVCSLFATLWGSVFFALRAKSATHAAFLTVLLVLIAPALVSFFVPSAPANFIPGPFMVLIVSSWLYILAGTAVWFLCRVRLNTLGLRAPAAIVDYRAFRE